MAVAICAKPCFATRSLPWALRRVAFPSWPCFRWALVQKLASQRLRGSGLFGRVR